MRLLENWSVLPEWILREACSSRFLRVSPFLRTRALLSSFSMCTGGLELYPGFGGSRQIVVYGEGS